MLRFLIPAFIIAIFTFYWIPLSIEETPVVSYLWSHSFDEHPVSDHPMLSNPPYNGFFDKASKRVHTVDTSIELDDGDLIDIPSQGLGYFLYHKVGSDLQFYSRKGELLWNKTYSSYPVSDHFGQLVLLLTGDNNQIDIIDSNGNSIGAGSVAGNFMSDFDFASRASFAGLVFAGGTAFVLNEKGLIDYKHQFSGNQQIVLKSTAISPDGKLLAVHYLQSKDQIAILKKSSQNAEDTSSSIVANLQLRNIHPHVLHFAVNEHALLLCAPDYTAFFNDKGKEIWHKDEEAKGVYRPVFADRDYFVYGSASGLHVLSSEGKLLVTFPAPEMPYRILPGARSNQFMVQSKGRVLYYSIRFST